MEKINCNFCNSSNYKIIAKSQDKLFKTSNEIFQIVECKSCGLCYTNPRPSELEISKYYSHNYIFFRDYSFFKFIIHKLLYMIANNNNIIAIFFQNLPILKNKLKFFLVPKKIENPVKPYRNFYFLDIGSGSGLENTHWWGKQGSLKYYSKFSKNLYAVEPNKKSHKSLNKNHIHSFYAIEKIDKSLTFDVIRMNWSLEHVHNPQKYFKFISEHLNKNGEAVICIPNFEGHLYNVDPSNSELPIHLYHFKFKNINDYCIKNKLKITYFKTFSYSTMYYQSSLINNNFSKFRNMSIKQLKNFQNKLDLLDAKNMGNDMVFKITHV